MHVRLPSVASVVDAERAERALAARGLAGPPRVPDDLGLPVEVTPMFDRLTADYDQCFTLPLAVHCLANDLLLIWLDDACTAIDL